MVEITVLTTNTTARVLHPLPTEDDAGFRRRMKAMVVVLRACDAETTAVYIVHPKGRPSCVVTQVHSTLNATA